MQRKSSAEIRSPACSSSFTSSCETDDDGCSRKRCSTAFVISTAFCPASAKSSYIRAPPDPAPSFMRAASSELRPDVVERRRPSRRRPGSSGTHAKTMFPATPQRTAESRFVAPEPITAPEITWVVESG